MVDVAADRCIHRMIMVNPAAARSRWEGGSRIGRGRHYRQGLRPRLHLENPRPQSRTHRRVLPATPPRPGNRPAAGGDREHRPSASPPARPSTARPTTRSTSRPTRAPAPGSAAPRPLPHLRRPPGPPSGSETHATAERLIQLEREAARHPATHHLLRRDRLVLQVHLDPARLHPRERAPRPPDGGPSRPSRTGPGGSRRSRRCCARANRAALEYLQSWAGITPTGYHGTRIDGREPGRLRAHQAHRHVLAAGHQPGRRPPGPHPQPDRPDHPHLPRRHFAPWTR